MNKQKAKLTLVFICAILTSISYCWSRTQYNLADLEVLKSGKSYEEFFEHAHDIIPSERNEYWREMVSSMALDYLDEKRSTNQYDTKSFKRITEIGLWPELKRDEFVQIKRNSYSLSYFKSCFTLHEKQSCHQQMRKFWTTAKQDLETSYQMAALDYGLFPTAAGSSAYVYIDKILHQEDDQFYCHRPIIQSIFLSHLRNQSLQTIAKAQRKIIMDQLLSKSCWKKMVGVLKKALDHDSPLSARSLFFALNLNDELDKVEYHEWMLRYFLQAPLPSELLNLSWNSLSKLSNDYVLREKVLKKLEQRDPLPGDIFSRLASNRSQSLVQHLQESFPEYIKLYALTCLNYLEGKGDYPFGNPTPKCHEFFRSTAKATKRIHDLLTPSWRLRYGALVPTSESITAKN